MAFPKHRVSPGRLAPDDEWTPQTPLDILSDHHWRYDDELENDLGPDWLTILHELHNSGHQIETMTTGNARIYRLEPPYQPHERPSIVDTGQWMPQ